MTARRPRPADVGLALLAFAVGAVELSARTHPDGPLAANLVVFGLMCVPLVWRRVAPLGALVASSLGAIVFAATLSRPQDIFGCFLLLSALAFAGGAYLEARRARLALAVVLALIVAVDVLTGDLGFGDQLFPIALFGGWWAMGRASAMRRRQNAELRSRAEQLERERSENERGAVARERARIARELHDVVAHSVSVMVVQSGAARRVLDHDPAASVAALGAVEDTGREALAEMRRLLGILRPDGEAAEHEPQPSLAAVDALVQRSRRAGLEVELRVDGAPGPLEPGST